MPLKAATPKDTEVLEVKETVTIQQEVTTEKPVFEYNNRTFESYAKKGLAIPENIRIQDQESIFLSLVDPKQIENIEKRITRIVRVKKPDLNQGGKRVLKDYMVIFENWYGKDWTGQSVPPVTDHIEGVYQEQDTEPEPFQNGRPTGKFIRTGQHEIHYLEWNKRVLDEILEKQTADKDEIVYHIEVMSGERRAPKYANSFTYEQFSTLPFDEMMKLTN